MSVSRIRICRHKLHTGFSESAIHYCDTAGKTSSQVFLGCRMWSRLVACALVLLQLGQMEPGRNVVPAGGRRLVPTGGAGRSLGWSEKELLALRRASAIVHQNGERGSSMSESERGRRLYNELLRSPRAPLQAVLTANSGSESDKRRRASRSPVGGTLQWKKINAACNDFHSFFNRVEAFCCPRGSASCSGKGKSLV
jgi:hypothetical protein